MLLHMYRYKERGTFGNCLVAITVLLCVQWKYVSCGTGLMASNYFNLCEAIIRQQIRNVDPWGSCFECRTLRVCFLRPARI